MPDVRVLDSTLPDALPPAADPAIGAADATSGDATRSAAALPVVSETLDVGKKEVETGAVRVRIEGRDVAVPLALEHSSSDWTVDRIRVDREVEVVREPWMDGDTLVVPVYQRVPQVVHRLVLVEELRLVRREQRETRTETMTVREEHAVVERRTADGAWQAVEPSPPAPGEG